MSIVWGKQSFKTKFNRNGAYNYPMGVKRQIDLFGRLVGSTHIVDIFGREHQSIDEMLGYWNDNSDLASDLEYPPHFFLRANPVATEFAKSQMDEVARIINPSEAIISADRNSSIYRLFNYHTKVPPEIARAFIETYSSPGQVILDPFCGSGMLGLGAHHGLNPEEHRKAILSDLSPAAAHLAWAYNSRPRKDMLNDERERKRKAVWEGRFSRESGGRARRRRERNVVVRRSGRAKANCRRAARRRHRKAVGGAVGGVTRID